MCRSNVVSFRLPSEEAESKSFDVIKRLLAPDAQGLKRTDLKRKHLEANCKFKTFWETHFVADRYKIEFHKTCWRQQLLNIQANNGGSLPPAEVKKCYAEFKCEFGCTPPRMPPEQFLELRPVPRPKLPEGASTGKYLSFEETYDTPTPYSAPDLKEGSATELAPPGTLQQQNVRATIKCNACPHVRCIYTKQAISSKQCGGRSGLDVLKEDVIEPIKNVWTCGDDLGDIGTEQDADGIFRSLENCSLLQGTARPYVRLTIHCATPTETQLYTCPDNDCTFPGTVLNDMCSYCGEQGSRMQQLDRDSPTDGGAFPTCVKCSTTIPGSDRVMVGGFSIDPDSAKLVQETPRHGRLRSLRQRQHPTLRLLHRPRHPRLRQPRQPRRLRLRLQ